MTLNICNRTAFDWKRSDQLYSKKYRLMDRDFAKILPLAMIRKKEEMDAVSSNVDLRGTRDTGNASTRMEISIAVLRGKYFVRAAEWKILRCVWQARVRHPDRTGWIDVDGSIKSMSGYNGRNKVHLGIIIGSDFLRKRSSRAQRGWIGNSARCTHDVVRYNSSRNAGEKIAKRLRQSVRGLWNSSWIFYSALYCREVDELSKLPSALM